MRILKVNTFYYQQKETEVHEDEEVEILLPSAIKSLVFSSIQKKRQKPSNLREEMLKAREDFSSRVSQTQLSSTPKGKSKGEIEQTSVTQYDSSSLSKGKILGKGNVEHRCHLQEVMVSCTHVDCQIEELMP